MLRLIVVDDHPVVREGLTAALVRRGFEVVAAFASADELLARSIEADVVLLDLELPGISGVEAVSRIRTRVLVLTAYANDQEIEAVLHAGAGGYLLKGASVDEIVRAIESVARGETWIDPRVASRVLSLSRETRLSVREREVLRHVADGRSNKEIAATLGVTERTVKFHVTSILRKLGAENRAQAVSISHQKRLV